MHEQQLDLFTVHPPVPDTGPTVRLVTVPRMGLCLESPAGAWRARDTNRWGWVFYRLFDGAWESAEPDLPYGVEHLSTQQEAVEALERFVAQHGDVDPARQLVGAA